MIYKRVLIAELLDRDGGLNGKIVRAVRDRACCMVNTFRCKILFKKASFAVLSDERNAKLFSDDRAGRHLGPYPVDPRGAGAQDASSTARRST